MPKVLSRKEKNLVLIFSFIALGALISLPVTALYHFTTEVPDYGGSLTEGVIGAPKHINPLLAQSNDADKDLASLIFSGLLKYNGKGDLVPDMAESYEISEDGLSYTFRLKDNLVWHDGYPVTIDDIIFTIITAQNSDYGSFQRISWQGVEFEKTDEKTVIFKLKNKYAQFLSSATMGILPKHIWENIKPTGFGLSEFNLKPIGSGPYKFSKIRRDIAGNIISFELAAFDKYHEGRPHISKITFKFYASEDKLVGAYNNNEIEGFSTLSSEGIGQINFPGRLKIRQIKLPRYFAIFFNQNQSKQLSDKNVRLALSHATDKGALVEKILDGKGMTVDSPILPGIINVSEIATKYEFGTGTATGILEETGWVYMASASEEIREKAAIEKSKTNQPEELLKLEIKLTTSDWPELVTAANEIKKQWEAIGARVNLEILPLPELQQAIKERNYEALLFGEVLSVDPDPFSFWHSSQKKDPGLNLALYDNQDADKLLEEARQTLDRSARLSKYTEFQEVVAKDIPAVFLYSPDFLYGQPSKIKGNDTELISMPSGRFSSVNKWYIETKRTFDPVRSSPSGSESN